MADRMSDAAKRYLENIDVLEEARTELREFLEAVWEEWRTRLDEAAEGAPGAADCPRFWRYKDDKPGTRGGWHMGVDGGLLGVEITLLDPRRTHRSSAAIEVRLELNKTNWGKLQKRGVATVERLRAAGGASGLELELDRSGTIWSEIVRLDMDSAKGSGVKLARRTRELLALVARFDGDLAEGSE